MKFLLTSYFLALILVWNVNYILMSIVKKEKVKTDEVKKLIDCKICQEMFQHEFNFEKLIKDESAVNIIKDFFMGINIENFNLKDYLTAANLENISKEISVQYFFKGEDSQFSSEENVEKMKACKNNKSAQNIKNNNPCDLLKLKLCENILSLESNLCMNLNSRIAFLKELTSPKDNEFDKFYKSEIRGESNFNSNVSSIDNNNYNDRDDEKENKNNNKPDKRLNNKIIDNKMTSDNQLNQKIESLSNTENNRLLSDISLPTDAISALSGLNLNSEKEINKQELNDEKQQKSKNLQMMIRKAGFNRNSNLNDILNSITTSKKENAKINLMDNLDQKQPRIGLGQSSEDKKSNIVNKNLAAENRITGKKHSKYISLDFADSVNEQLNSLKNNNKEEFLSKAIGNLLNLFIF